VTWKQLSGYCKAFQKCHNLQWRGCCALRNLVGCSIGKAKAIESGGIEVLLAAVNNHLVSADVCVDACLALAREQNDNNFFRKEHYTVIYFNVILHKPFQKDPNCLRVVTTKKTEKGTTIKVLVGARFSLRKMKALTCLCGTVACLVAAVATTFAVVLYIGDAQTALDLSRAEYSYRESVYHDGSEMYMLSVECPVTDPRKGCGFRPALMDIHVLKYEKYQSYTNRAARLYGAPDSVTHLSGQFYFGRDGKMFANVSTVVAVDSLEQANFLANDVNSKLEKGEEIRAVRLGSGPAIRCSAANLVSAQMRIQRFWVVPEVLDLAHHHGHQEPPFMAALIYLEEVHGVNTGNGMGSDIDLLFFLYGLPKTSEL
jgi:hypothetical protein